MRLRLFVSLSVSQVLHDPRRFAIAALQQQIQFCTTKDGVRIAHASVGNGPPLVKAAHWLTHVQFDPDSPVWSPWIREFSQHHRYIRYDERGLGLSDWEPKDFSFEGWICDLETVVDSLGLEKFDLLGFSQGSMVSIAYAARHPERVSRLILGGASAKGWRNWNLDPGYLQRIEAFVTIMKTGWGGNTPFARRVFTAAFIPESTLKQQLWFDELERISSTPETAVRLLNEVGNVNVESLLPKISAPTLILHARGDVVFPFQLGRELAGKIPNSRFVPLEGNNHIFLEGEPAWDKFLSEIRNFLEVKETVHEAPAKKKNLGLPGWLKGPGNQD